MASGNLCEFDVDCGDGFVCIGGRCVPDDFGSGGPPAQLPGLGRFLRSRYTSNVAVTEQMAAIDLLNEVIFPAMRGYLAQNEKGQLALRNKKPVPYAFGTEQFSAGETALDVDNVADWIDDIGSWLLIAPHTTSSEIRTVSAAIYPTSQNSITLSSTGGLFTITGFSGCDGASTPATATIEVTTATDTACTITLESTTFDFLTSTSDTVASIAGYIAGIIASHPSLWRRFAVEFDGVDTVTLTARFGTLTVDSGLEFTTGTPVADPASAPTLTAAGGGALAAGAYYVGYSYVNSAGETLMSPYKTVTLTANQKINVTTVSLPGGVTSLNWYCSTEADSNKLRFLVNNDGTGFSINALPKLSATLTPDLNRTGCEVMRVSAVYSDRAETRTGTTRSNVIKSSMVWSLGKTDDTVNEIQLKYRDASDDWRLVTLKLRDDANIAKIKATKSKEINGQAIDNTDQAYRIAAGELSLRQDANFFYALTATRKALLQQEGDVIAITDDGSGVYNFPAMVEGLEFGIDGKGLPAVTLTCRKYGSRLFDDSIVEHTIPVISEDAIAR